MAHGGVRFVQSLAQLDLVEEYRLYTYPIAIGSGTSLIADLETPAGSAPDHQHRIPLGRGRAGVL